MTQFDWTGAFVGANVGGAWSSYNALNGLYASSGSISSAGPFGGVQAGYLYMLPSRFVFGGSAAVDWNGSGSTTTAVNGANIVSDKTSFGLSGNVVGRAGYAFGDIMPYAIGGWAWQNETDLQTQLLGKAGGVIAGPERAILVRQDRVGARSRTCLPVLPELVGLWPIPI